MIKCSVWNQLVCISFLLVLSLVLFEGKSPLKKSPNMMGRHVLNKYLVYHIHLSKQNKSPKIFIQYMRAMAMRKTFKFESVQCSVSGVYPYSFLSRVLSRNFERLAENVKKSKIWHSEF